MKKRIARILMISLLASSLASVHAAENVSNQVTIVQTGVHEFELNKKRVLLVPEEYAAEKAIQQLYEALKKEGLDRGLLPSLQVYFIPKDGMGKSAERIPELGQIYLYPSSKSDLTSAIYRETGKMVYEGFLTQEERMAYQKLRRWNPYDKQQEEKSKEGFGEDWAQIFLPPTLSFQRTSEKPSLSLSEQKKFKDFLLQVWENHRTFSDVDTSHWAYDAILDLYEQGILTRPVQGSFYYGLHEGMPQQEFIKAFGKVHGKKTGKKPALGNVKPTNLPMRKGEVYDLLNRNMPHQGSLHWFYHFSISSKMSEKLRQALELKELNAMYDPYYVITRAEAALILDTYLNQER